MDNKDRFLSGHHFTISKMVGQFAYYFDPEHSHVLHYRGKTLEPRRMGAVVIGDTSFTITIKGLRVDHDESVPFSTLDFML